MVTSCRGTIFDHTTLLGMTRPHSASDWQSGGGSLFEYLWDKTNNLKKIKVAHTHIFEAGRRKHLDIFLLH